MASAQNIDSFFSLANEPLISSSTTIPHVSIYGTGNGTFDYYSFTVSTQGSRGIFDIDFGITGTGFFSRRGIDTELFLFDNAGNFLVGNNQSDISNGADGSLSLSDAYLEYTFGTAGRYIIGVGEYDSFGAYGGITCNLPDSGDNYRLNVSIQNHLA